MICKKHNLRLGIISFLFMVFAVGTNVHGQYFPSRLACASVSTSGDVTITWQQPSDVSAGFDAYLIYYSQNGVAGPFTHIMTISNLVNTNFTHTGTPALNSPVAYYILTRYTGNNFSLPSDTLQTMVLNVADIAPESARLDWNTLYGNPSMPLHNDYDIYREYPAGIWTLVDSSSIRTFFDTLKYICNKVINYKIVVQDSMGCTSESTVEGKTFIDQIPPVAPVLDSVSVDPANHVLIGWEPSSSADTYGYFIYFGPNNLFLDTIYGRDNTFYTDTQHDASGASLIYTIAAFDSCNFNKSPLVPNQRTIHLTLTKNVCKNEITLHWNSYINMNPRLVGYRIFVSMNGGSYSLLAYVDTANRDYVCRNLQDDVLYCYYVQAYSMTGNTASSNIVCQMINQPQTLQYAYLRYATVVNNSYIHLQWYTDTAYPVAYCQVLRSEDGLLYDEIATIPANGTHNQGFDDNTAEVSRLSYYYKVRAYDSCGVGYVESNYVKTILLSGYVYDNMSNFLTWSSYRGFLGNVNHYTIYRSFDSYATLAPFKDFQSSYTGTDIYTDNLDGLYYTNGKFYYAVEAVEGGTNPYGFQDSSRSNAIEIVQSPRVYVPNAFCPSGYNKIFMPFGVFINSDFYEFTVYDRNGHQVYQTNKTNEGWDGTYKGSPMPVGAYAYIIKFRFSSGVEFMKTGTVTLFK